MGAVTGDEPVGLGLIGSGWMGAFHGESLARRILGARLVAVADPAPGTAERLAADARRCRAYTDAGRGCSPTPTSTAWSSRRRPASTPTWWSPPPPPARPSSREKPMALTLADADRAVAAAAAAGVPLQVGFNRRFAADFAAARPSPRRGGSARRSCCDR